MEETGSDVVTEQWLRSHGIVIRRAEGVHQSPSAWVKVNSSGVITAAGVADQRIVAWLVEQGILSSADIDYAIAYVTCRDAHRAYRKERGYKSCIDITAAGGSLSCEQAAEVFSLLCKELGRKNRDIVEYACDTARSPHHKPNYVPPYRIAFTALARSFDAAVKKLRENP
jgi:hypothetical protein